MSQTIDIRKNMIFPVVELLSRAQITPMSDVLISINRGGGGAGPVLDLSCASGLFSGYAGFPASPKSTHTGL